MGIIAWCDMETTGLDHRNDPVLEVAMIVTSQTTLTTIAERSWMALPPDWPTVRAGLHERVLDMHTANGLLADIDALHDAPHSDDECLSLYDVETEIVEWLGRLNPARGQVALGGSGVANFDRPVIRVQMPRLSEMLTYWTYDIGMLRRFGGLVGIRAPAEASDASTKTHRAMDDTRQHLAEARWWVDFLRRVRKAGIRGLDTADWGDVDEIAAAAETVAAAYLSERDGRGTGWYPADDFAEWFTGRAGIDLPDEAP